MGLSKSGTGRQQPHVDAFTVKTLFENSIFKTKGEKSSMRKAKGVYEEKRVGVMDNVQIYNGGPGKGHGKKKLWAIGGEKRTKTESVDRGGNVGENVTAFTQKGGGLGGRGGEKGGGNIK